jgi:membrane protease YdiL (CAAX protease family)
MPLRHGLVGSLKSGPLAQGLVALFASVLIATVGALPWLILSRLNLSYWPQVPWSAVGTLVYLGLLWQYLGGAGWPRKTAAYRRAALRAAPLGPSRWSHALVVVLTGAAALVALYVLCIKEAHVPLVALRPSFDAAKLPVQAQICAVIMTGLVAAVVEEAAYRGYLQSSFERLWSPKAAVVTIAGVFTLAHLPAASSHPVLLIPVFAAAILFGAVAVIFGSILPCILLHAVTDWLALPVEWGLIEPRWLTWLETAGLDGFAVVLSVVVMLSGALTIWTLGRVAHRTVEEPRL